MSTEKSRGWKVQLAPYGEYWRIYGGHTALFSSIYFYGSIAITALCFPIWIRDGWWDMSISLLPSLIGFLIGTFGLMLAFGGDYFKSLMARAPGSKIYSALDSASASFCHFLVVQFAALLISLLAKSSWMLGCPWFASPIGKNSLLVFWGFGFFLLVYGVACALASVMTIFRIARQITIVENVAKLPLDKPAKEIDQDPKE